MDLLRIEFRKILPYRTYWVILGIYVLLLVLIVYASSSITINGQQMGGRTYQFPDLWPRLTYIASFFNLLLGILLIVLVSDEYSFRTIRQQVIDGLSRLEVVLAKFYVVLGVAAFSTLFLLVLGLLFGLMYSTEKTASAVLSQLPALLYLFVQAVGFMTLAMFFAFLIKKSGLAIIAFIAYSMVLEPILRALMPDHIDKFMPTKVLASLTPLPLQQMMDQVTAPTEQLSPAWATPMALAYIGLFLFLSYMLLKLRDL